MRYLGTEKIRCRRCQAELDVPVYINGDKKKCRFKFCHQCGESLFDISADVRSKLIDYLYEVNVRADIKVENLADDIIAITTNSLK